MTDSSEPISPDETDVATADATPEVSPPDLAGTVTEQAGTGSETIDLDAIEADLDAVQTALARLADGSYWTDEVTGEPIAAEILTADPLARRN